MYAGHSCNVAEESENQHGGKNKTKRIVPTAKSPSYWLFHFSRFFFASLFPSIKVLMIWKKEKNDLPASNPNALNL